MKRFVRNVLLFLLPLLLLGIWIAVRPLDKHFAFRYIEGDCLGHGRWIHDRIAENPLPIDVAFVGTSRTVRAVDDTQIERRLRDGYDRPLHVANLGYCRPGRDLHHVIVKALLGERPVRLLIVEVDNTENPHGHPMLGYVADGSDLVPPLRLLHGSVPRDLGHAFQVRFESLRHGWLLGNEGLRPRDDRSHAFVPVDRVADPEGMARAKAAKEARAKHRKAPSPRLAGYPRLHLERIVEEARARGTEVVFLYLQSYGAAWLQMRERTFYESLAPIWIPPRELFQDPSMWSDTTHLNTAGSDRLAPWLAARIAETLKR